MRCSGDDDGEIRDLCSQQLAKSEATAETAYLTTGSDSRVGESGGQLTSSVGVVLSCQLQLPITVAWRLTYIF